MPQKIVFPELIILRLQMDLVEGILGDQIAVGITYRIIDLQVKDILVIGHSGQRCVSGINIFIVVVNLFYPWMYYFDEANYYHRNNSWYVYTLISLVAIFIGAGN